MRKETDEFTIKTSNNRSIKLTDKEWFLILMKSVFSGALATFLYFKKSGKSYDEHNMYGTNYNSLDEGAIGLINEIVDSNDDENIDYEDLDERTIDVIKEITYGGMTRDCIVTLAKLISLKYNKNAIEFFSVTAAEAFKDYFSVEDTKSVTINETILGNFFCEILEDTSECVYEDKTIIEWADRSSDIVKKYREKSLEDIKKQLNNKKIKEKEAEEKLKLFHSRRNILVNYYNTNYVNKLNTYKKELISFAKGLNLKFRLDTAISDKQDIWTSLSLNELKAKIEKEKEIIHNEVKQKILELMAIGKKKLEEEEKQKKIEEEKQKKIEEEKQKKIEEKNKKNEEARQKKLEEDKKRIIRKNMLSKMKNMFSKMKKISYDTKYNDFLKGIEEIDLKYRHDNQNVPADISKEDIELGEEKLAILTSRYNYSHNITDAKDSRFKNLFGQNKAITNNDNNLINEQQKQEDKKAHEIANSTKADGLKLINEAKRKKQDKHH